MLNNKTILNIVFLLASIVMGVGEAPAGKLPDTMGVAGKPSMGTAGEPSMGVANTTPAGKLPGTIVVADSANFVRASVMIASPDYERTQSSFGHMFLRMECPSAGLDYCFSFESGYAPGVFSIFTGDYHVRLVRVNSNEYMQTYASERRKITGYALNLSLREEQRLWKRLDEIHAMGDYPEHDYFHHGCSQELMNIIEEVVDGRIVYDESRLPYGKTINILGPSALPKDHPVRLAPLLFSQDGTDRVLEPGQRLFMPIAVPEYLKEAEICPFPPSPDSSVRSADSAPAGLTLGLPSRGSPSSKALASSLRARGDSDSSNDSENSDSSNDSESTMGRPLLDGTVETYYAEEAKPYEEGWPIWSWFLMALVAVVIVSGLEAMGRCPKWLSVMTDTSVFAVYAVMTVLLCAVYAVSTLPTTSGWCWHFLVYNPVFLVLGILVASGVLTTKAQRAIGWAVAAWLVLYMAGMAIAGDMLWGYQYLMIGTMALRSAISDKR